MNVRGFNKIIVNAVDYADVKVFCVALYRAMAKGKVQQEQRLHQLLFRVQSHRLCQLCTEQQCFMRVQLYWILYRMVPFSMHQPGQWECRSMREANCYR